MVFSMTFSDFSRSREEKSFFDDTFGPFYRTAQIYIKPTYTEDVRYFDLICIPM